MLKLSRRKKIDSDLYVVKFPSWPMTSQEIRHELSWHGISQLRCKQLDKEGLTTVTPQYQLITIENLEIINAF